MRSESSYLIPLCYKSTLLTSSNQQRYTFYFFLTHTWRVVTFSLCQAHSLQTGRKQNITRDIVVKNNLTIARGEGGGDSGERGIQDTWTKSRGRVEAREGGGFGWDGVEGWGENADNCN